MITSKDNFPTTLDSKVDCMHFFIKNICTSLPIPVLAQYSFLLLWVGLVDLQWTWNSVYLQELNIQRPPTPTRGRPQAAGDRNSLAYI